MSNVVSRKFFVTRSFEYSATRNPKLIETERFEKSGSKIYSAKIVDI